MTPSMDLKFEAPGPGTWVLDTQHFPTPLTRFMSEIMSPTISMAGSDTMARYGSFVVRTGVAINGFHYGRIHSFGTEPGSSEAPQADNPEVRERLNRAVEKFNGRYWQEE